MSALRVVGGLLALVAIAASGLFAMTLGSSVSATRQAAAGVPAEATQVDISIDGRQLFLNTCATCHGADGRGTAIGPSLENAGSAAFDFFLRTGRMPLSAPGQPSFEQGTILSEAQIQALVAYGASLGTGPAIPQLVTDANLPDGYQLFINNCAQCHGATGAGGSIGQGVFAPSLRGRTPQLVAEAVLVGPGAMPAFKWSAQQLSDVAAYVQQLSVGPSPGGLSLGGYGPVPEGLVAVVVGLGLIVLVVRWIARPTSGTAIEGPPAAGES